MTINCCVIPWILLPGARDTISFHESSVCKLSSADPAETYAMSLLFWIFQTLRNYSVTRRAGYHLVTRHTGYTSHPAFQFAQFPFFVLAETLTIPLYFLLRQTINANFHEFGYPARRVTSWYPGAPGTISHPSFHFAMFPLTLQKRSEA